MNPESKQQALILREQGHTIKKIASQLGCSTATISIAVRDVSLRLPKKIKKIYQEIPMIPYLSWKKILPNTRIRSSFSMFMHGISADKSGTSLALMSKPKLLFA